MSNTIFDSFLTVEDCKYYCKEIASQMRLSTYDYFFDKRSGLKFPGNSDLYSFVVFNEYESWRLKFNLTKPQAIKKMGLREYISKNHELIFNLAIKGFSFLYVCKFSDKKVEDEAAVQHEYIDKATNTLYIYRKAK